MRFAHAPADDFLAVMRRYHAHKTVFVSKERHALYVVSAVDESAATVDRLTANDPIRAENRF